MTFEEDTTVHTKKRKATSSPASPSSSHPQQPSFSSPTVETSIINDTFNTNVTSTVATTTAATPTQQSSTTISTTPTAAFTDTSTTTTTTPATETISTTTTTTTINTIPIIPPPKQKQRKIQNDYSEIKHTIVTNNGSKSNLIKLIGLKSLFAKQLPKMPKQYIVRLVFDRNHTSLAILSDNPNHQGTDDEIVGGICYRAYETMKFAEIAFCAVNGSQQVKGYGTKLMNLLKQHAVLEGIEYFITYADNYATGYFKKQGFSKTISMPKSRFHGLIKDYDGANLMECYIHPSVDYTRIPEMLNAQRDYILSRIRKVSKSDKIVYPPLPPGWIENTSSRHGPSSRVADVASRALRIRGVTEAGWTQKDVLASTTAAKDSDLQKNKLKSDLLAIIRKTEEQQFAWPFRQPVDTTEVTDYLDVIKDPIDLSTIEKRIRKGEWYKSKQMLHTDLMRMVHNCKLYNEPKTLYYDCATQLEKFVSNLLTKK